MKIPLVDHSHIFCCQLGGWDLGCLFHGSLLEIHGRRLAHTLELTQGNSLQVLMLEEDLALLLAEVRGELILVGAFLVHVPDLGLSTGLFKEICSSNLLPSHLHVKGWSNFAEGYSFHLHSGLCDVLAFEMSEFNRVHFSTAGEHHHSLQLLNVSFFQLLVVEEICSKKIKGSEL